MTGRTVPIVIKRNGEEMTERNILITSLDSMENRTEHRFFYIKEGRKTLYCDAIGVAEAGTKYILSRESIDEIIVLGTGATYKEGDELRHMQLRDFDGYGGEDTETLSEYSFYRYRIAQFLDDLNFEGGDVLREVLEAYYAIAPLRNIINHAASRRRDFDPDNIDINEKNEGLELLNHAITRFINAYEAALEAREPGENPVRIRSYEFRDYTKANRPERRK